jgi:hypothetical protein
MADERMPEKPTGSELVISRISGRPTKGDKPPARRSKGKAKAMAKPAFRERDTDSGYTGSEPPRKEQTPRKSGPAPSEWYVRLRVRAEDGELRVLDSHPVEGPLVEAPVLNGNFAYEVTLGDTRLHSESIPDLGVARSFASPDGPPELREHHVRQLSQYDFNVRVPSTALRRASLSKIEITLYRMKERPAQRVSGTAPLQTQFEREVRPIARLQGVPRDLIPERYPRKR